MLSTDTDTSKTQYTHLHALIRTHNFEHNVEFDFDVSVSNCMLSTDSSKSNLMFGTFRSICPGGKKQLLGIFSRALHFGESSDGIKRPSTQ